jgi:hypothetical protein
VLEDDGTLQWPLAQSNDWLSRRRSS